MVTETSTAAADGQGERAFARYLKLAP